MNVLVELTVDYNLEQLIQLVSSNYFHIITIICWQTVIWFHVTNNNNGPVGWNCRIHRLHLHHNLCPANDTKQSDDEASVMLELWRMLNIPLLPLLPNPLWSGVIAPDRVLFMGQIELFDI